MNRGKMMGIARILIVVLVAGLLGACSASSGIDGTFSPTGLGTGPVESPTNAQPLAVTKTEAGTSTLSSPAVRKSAEALVAVSKPGSSAYKIGPLDVLEVSVFKVPDLSKVVQVSEAGTIGYPLLGEVEAAGKTAREVEIVMTKRLGAKYLQKPQVTVFIKQYNSQRVTVEGAVKKPGVFPIQGNLTLLQLLATAGGLDELADSTVIVFRDKDGKRAAARFDVAQVRNGKASDPKLQAGDVVVVAKSATKEAFENVLKALRFTSVFALL